jgi:hypothetical protein
MVKELGVYAEFKAVEDTASHSNMVTTLVSLLLIPSLCCAFSALNGRTLRFKSSLSTALSMNKDNKDNSKDNAGARQLMGIKGASETTNKWAIRLQLCKPVTWIPLIWGVACGAAASGNYHTWNPFGAGDVPNSLVIEDALKAFSCMVLSGPILTGYTQTLNDWEDRAIDAINEPYRPIPSGM